VKNHSDLDIDFHMVGFDHRPDVDTETVLYRFSQEALTNTLKHSGAKHFRLSIIKSYPKIIFLAPFWAETFKYMADRGKGPAFA
jgi:signal transduction histidine kinase